MDRLDRIRIFQMVADHTSFAEAARRLQIPSVAASREVAALEKELGVTLLRRTTRSVGLTKQGADYLARSRRALAELDDAARALRGEDAHPRGQLVVTNLAHHTDLLADFPYLGPPHIAFAARPVA